MPNPLHRLSGGLIAALAGATVLAVAAPAHAADPRPDNPKGATVAIAASTVAPGGTLAFTGTGFVNADGTGSNVVVKVDDGQVRKADGGDIFAEVKAADTTGAVSGTVTLPAGVTGAGHWLRMLTGAPDEVRSLHTALFAVEAPKVAAVTLAGSTVEAGGTLAASGVNFPPAATVTVKLDRAATLTTFTSGADGSFADRGIAVPASAAAGPHTLNFLAAGGVSVAVPFTVAAAPDPDAPTAAVTITTSVPDTGALAIKVGATTVALSTPQVTPELDALVATGALPTVTVSDLRGVDAGWTVSGQIGDFTGAAGTIDGRFLGWTPKVLTTATGQTVAAGGAVPAGTGLKAAAPLATAAAGKGRGTATLGADLQLRLPTTTLPGSYTATLTLTAI
ncbi:WxL domain-containing protein [Spirilliplanes yamanashiensis]|uniref:WxL domain-containing protein n=1 Tax=Spirilliplanes yamanashiensis TaxID=42233 RepID=UPI00194F091B|nr:WxL domain-containing protein [Spirilliplanes yamanashiensis]MDP9814761.1 hypothetical protein [Spirilliplanes yamanashiensis]